MSPRRLGMRRKAKLAATLAFAAGALTFNPPEASGSCYRCCQGQYGECSFCACWEQVPSEYWGCSPSWNCGDPCAFCNDNSCGGGWLGSCFVR